MKISYGYTDATGDYYITVDTDKCNGCGDCVPVCPKDLLETHIDDYDETVIQVRPAVVKKLGFLCPGKESGQREGSCGIACQAVCPFDVFEHSW
jgi:ferredoxin